MITSPNELSGCVVWLDASDTSTMYRDVTSTFRTNLLTNSEDIGTAWQNASWSNSVSLNVSQTTAPNGTYTADKFGEEAGTTSLQHYRQRFLTVPAGTYTFSIYVKAAERTFCYIDAYNGSYVGLYVNLTTGASLTSVATVPGSAIPVGNGWYRAWFTFPSITTPTIRIFSASSLTDSYTLSQSPAGAGFYVWGAQLEVGTVPTAYIESGSIPGIAPNDSGTPVLQVSANGHTVGHWGNKSLSATFYGVSAFNRLYGGDTTRPTLQTTTWNSDLSTVVFDGSDDYLTATLATPLSYTSQTVFMVASINSTYTNQSGRLLTQSALTGSDTNANNLLPLYYSSGSVASWVNSQSSPVTVPTFSVPNIFTTVRRTSNQIINAINGIPSNTFTTIVPITGTTSVMRIGSGIGNTIQSVPTNTTTALNVGEVIVYNRELSVSEKSDVEYYLGRKWYNGGVRRTVYALNNGNLSNSSILSINTEPGVWNTLLSTDRFFTNTYTITADTSRRLLFLSNYFSPAYLSGGIVYLNNNVSLTSDIAYGGSLSGLSAALTMSPNTTGYLLGNIYQLGSVAGTHGVFLSGISGSTNNITLYLSGNVTGGTGANSYGMFLSGDSGLNAIHIGNVTGGTGVNSNGVRVGGTSTYNVSRTIVTGGGLSNQISTPGIQLINSVSATVVGGVRGGMTWNDSALQIVNPGIALLNTSTLTVIGNISGGAVVDQSRSFIASAIYNTAGCTFYLYGNSENYSGLTTGERYEGYGIHNNGGTVYVYGDIRSTRSFDPRFRNTYRAYGLYNVSSGTVYVSGDVYGGFSSRTDSDYPNWGIYNYNTSGTIFVNGNVYGGGNFAQGGSYGIYTTSSIEVTGNLISNGYVGGAIKSTAGTVKVIGAIGDAVGNVPTLDSTAGVILSGSVGNPSATSPALVCDALTALAATPNISFSKTGQVPYRTRRLYLRPLTTNPVLYTRFAKDGLGQYTTFWTSNATFDYPLSTNVLKDTTYNNASLTGTFVLPPASSTYLGIPIGTNTNTGTAFILGDALWNQSISLSTFNTQNTIGQKLTRLLTTTALTNTVNGVNFTTQAINI